MYKLAIITQSFYIVHSVYLWLDFSELFSQIVLQLHLLLSYTLITIIITLITIIYFYYNNYYPYYYFITRIYYYY